MILAIAMVVAHVLHIVAASLTLADIGTFFPLELLPDHL